MCVRVCGCVRAYHCVSIDRLSLFKSFTFFHFNLATTNRRKKKFASQSTSCPSSRSYVELLAHRRNLRAKAAAGAIREPSVYFPSQFLLSIFPERLELIDFLEGAAPFVDVDVVVIL